MIVDIDTAIEVVDEKDLTFRLEAIDYLENSLTEFNVENIADIIKIQYWARKMVWPNTKDALIWLITEVGEALEQVMAMPDNPQWVRNNPQDKEPYDKDFLAYELADIIFMAMVAGRSIGVNPLEYMIRKSLHKTREGLEGELANRR